MSENICGTCQHHLYDDDGDWVCTNFESENVFDWTDYSDTCDEWEARGMSETCMKATDALRQVAYMIEYMETNPLTPSGIQWCIDTIRVGAEQLEKFQEETFAARRAVPEARALTIEELIAQRNKPVWWIDLDDTPYDETGCWIIVNLDNLPRSWYAYGKTWLAYDRQPVEGARG